MNLRSKTICTRSRIRLKVEQVPATWCQHLQSFGEEDELILFDEKRNNSCVYIYVYKSHSLFLCLLRSKWLWIKIVMFMLYSVRIRMHAESMLEVLHVQNYIRLFGCSVFVSICHPPCTSETLQLPSSMCCYFESLKSPQIIYSRASLELRLLSEPWTVHDTADGHEWHQFAWSSEWIHFGSYWNSDAPSCDLVVSWRRIQDPAQLLRVWNGCPSRVCR